ncbi:transposase [Mycobacterium haemophilum DSM 44634]
MVFPLVREMAATGARIRVPVAVACRVLGLSTQGYYRWRKAPVSQRDWDDAHTINVLHEIHQGDPTLGYRFLTDELEDLGIAASENRRIQLVVATPRDRGGVRWFVDSKQRTGQSARSFDRQGTRSISVMSRWRSGRRSPKGFSPKKPRALSAWRRRSGRAGSTTLAACHRST